MAWWRSPINALTRPPTLPAAVRARWTDNTSALRADETRNRQITERIPAGRWGCPADLGGAVVFLSSPASDYVHGHVLVVDGGPIVQSDGILLHLAREHRALGWEVDPDRLTEWLFWEANRIGISLPNLRLYTHFKLPAEPNVAAWLDRIKALPGWQHPYALMR